MCLIFTLQHQCLYALVQGPLLPKLKRVGWHGRWVFFVFIDKLNSEHQSI